MRSGPVGCSWVMYLGQEFLWTETLCTLVPEVFLDFFSRKRSRASREAATTRRARVVVAASRLVLDLFREEKSRKTSGTRVLIMRKNIVIRDF